MAPADALSMEVLAPRRPVDHRLSLKIYFRAADNILKQANIYRREANEFELYVLLLRYASLVSETIPGHRQFHGMNSLDRSHLKRKLLEALEELESLKGGVQMRIQQQRAPPPSRTQTFAVEEKLQTFSLSRSQTFSVKENLQPFQSNGYHTPNSYFGRLPTPSAESLAKHSFLAKTQSNTSVEPFKVTYPSLFEAPAPAPAPVPSESLKLQEEADLIGEEEPAPPEQKPSQFDLLNQLVPPPVPAPVQQVEASLPATTDLSADVNQSKEPRNLHISAKMMDEFLRMARSNTAKSIETCGVLAGTLEHGKFFITTLIIPKQEATANTCEAIDEEEIFLAQDKRGLFQLGWIHTHPTQSCFMSSVDIHTHYSYQVMLQESIAIVMAPQDVSRSYGIFRLSDPGGMGVIQMCSKRGFHGHDNPSDGSPIYEQCSHVYLDSKVGFDVIDLR